jgi:hypothetical protein
MNTARLLPLPEPEVTPEARARIAAFVANKLSRALIRAHCSASIYEGLHDAYHEHLQWMDNDTLPGSLGNSVEKLFSDLTDRLEEAKNGNPLNADEAQRFLDRLEESLELAIIAMNSAIQRSTR